MTADLSAVLAARPGWFALACAATAILSYFFGCFNGAVVVSRYILRNDVRAHGSGNAGLTNFHRVFGGPLTALVILSDVVKAVAATLFTAWIMSLLAPGLAIFGKYWAGLFCLVGHMFPCMFQFRGGKGILSGGAMAIVIDWRIALIVWGGFLLLAIFTRYVSLGSCYAAAAFPVATAIFYPDAVLILLAVVIGGLILWKHRSNIKRLISGTESKFSLHKKSPPPEPPAAGEGDAPAASEETEAKGK